MPMEGDNTGGYDVSGGLEEVGDLPRRNYRPGFATTYEYANISGVRPEYYKFYKAPGTGHVS